MVTIKTPQKRIDVPLGYIFIHEKWQESPLAQELQKKSKGCCYEDLGVVDFLPSSSCPVLYLNEADLLCSSSSEAKVKALAKEYPKCRGIVIMMQSSSTHDSFNEIQKLAVIHLSLTVVPITSSQSLPDLLMQMVRIESTSPVNPFKFKKKKVEAHSDQEQQVILLSAIPGIRETNALKLLKVFGTIAAICNAPFSKLAAAVGNSNAKSVMDFFHGCGKWTKN